MTPRTNPNLREKARRMSVNAAMCNEWEDQAKRAKRQAQQLAQAVLRGDKVAAEYLAAAILNHGNT